MQRLFRVNNYTIVPLSHLLQIDKLLFGFLFFLLFLMLFCRGFFARHILRLGWALLGDDDSFGFHFALFFKKGGRSDKEWILSRFGQGGLQLEICGCCVCYAEWTVIDNDIWTISFTSALLDTWLPPRRILIINVDSPKFNIRFFAPMRGASSASWSRKTSRGARSANDTYLGFLKRVDSRAECGSVWCQACRCPKWSSIFNTLIALWFAFILIEVAQPTSLRETIPLAMPAQVVQNVRLCFEYHVFDLNPGLFFQLFDLVLSELPIAQGNLSNILLLVNWLLMWVLLVGLIVSFSLLYFVLLGYSFNYIFQARLVDNPRLFIQRFNLFWCKRGNLVIKSHVLPELELLVVGCVEKVHALLDFFRGHNSIVVHGLDQCCVLSAEVYKHLRTVLT